jgi:hypothetical protein
VTTDTPPPRFEDRLLEALELFLAEHAPADRAEPAGPARGRRAPRRVAVAAIPVAAAAAAIILAPSLDGGSTPLAQAAVLARAAAALDQPGSILDLRAQVYTSDGFGACFLGLKPPLPCVTGPASPGGAGLDPDPANDTLTYSLEQWRSPDGSTERSLYSDGVEAADSTGQVSVYDPADDTLTTLTGVPSGDGTPAPPDPLAATSPIGIGSALLEPSYFQQLYQDAQAGGQQTVGQTTLTTRFDGETQLDGQSVYELEFDLQLPPQPGGPAAATPLLETLLYLDSQTFLPVRVVDEVVRATAGAGGPAGTTISSVADYSVQELPDTPANEALLAMSPHPGATQVQETEAQYLAQNYPPAAAGQQSDARRRPARSARLTPAASRSRSGRRS